ncbi:hypothetical protein V9T40_012464 [Parthenolecanium corni]|uniref:Uncharacterized protein n=1 Tax=Parthenolecanium corni TaxID=536013 RepID=A0AAN9T7B6_9HEMI
MSSDDGTESTTDSLALTEDQEAFVKECEAEFCDRYTEKDDDYKKLKEVGIGDPPIVEPWYSKPRRNFDWSLKDKARGDNRQEDSYRQRNSYRQGDSNRQHQNNRRDNYHNNKHRSYHDYRSRPY